MLAAEPTFPTFIKDMGVKLSAPLLTNTSPCGSQGNEILKLLPTHHTTVKLPLPSTKFSTLWFEKRCEKPM